MGSCVTSPNNAITSARVLRVRHAFPHALSRARPPCELHLRKRHKGSCKPYYQAGLEHALIGLPAAEHAKELLTQESNFYQQFSTALKIPLMKRNHCDFLN